MDNIIKYIEPHLAERIESAKRHAKFIKLGKNIETIEDAELFLRYVLSKHYKIPIFSNYFEKRTIDQLFFEVELIQEGDSFHSVKHTSDIIKENADEIEALANEMEEEWNPIDSPPMDESLESDPVFRMAQEFMKTGNFIGEDSDQQEFIKPTEEVETTKEDTENDWQRTDMD